MSEFKYKSNDNLKRIAKHIFGEDVVVDAYVVQQYFDIYGFDSLSKSIEYFNNQLLSSDLDFDAETFIIELCNGKKVLFNSSEWGRISDITDDEGYKEI